MPVKLALLNDRLYVNASLVNQAHLEAYTHRYMVKVTEPAGSGKACGNCKYWMKPWMEAGKQQYCHELGYIETDSCNDFEARMETREIEYTLESFKKTGSVYAFARGDIGKLIRTFPDFDIVDERATPPLGYDLRFTSQLRDDQLPVARAWLRKGYGIIKSPTGSGKSVLLSYLMGHLGLRTLILSHETRHLDTLYQRICEHTNLLALEAETGQQIAGRFLEGKGDFPITFSTFQAFGSDQGKAALPGLKDRFGLVWVDECFPAGTRIGRIVDGKLTEDTAIEDVRAGDMVACFDTSATGHPGVIERRVVRTMRRDASSLVSVRIREYSVICTPNHRFWTNTGWCAASECCGKVVLVARETVNGPTTEWQYVDYVVPVEGTPVVYNLEVEDTHTYFANGVGVSNCHHTSAPTYHTVFSSFNSQYRGGTTATPTRKDQTHWATYNSIGPITAEGGNEMLGCNVTWIRTGISVPSNLFRFTKYAWSKMLDWLGQNSDLKALVLENVLRDLEAGYKPLIICERLAMVHHLNRMLTHNGYNVEVIVGGQAKKKSTKANKMGVATDFDALSQKLLEGTMHCVIGTNVLNENIDIRPLDCLHLPFPSANEEMEEQRAGRIRRPLHPRDIAAGFVKNDPEIRVYTFDGHRIAATGETTRKTVYERLGFTGVASEGTPKVNKKKRLSLLDD